MLPPNQTTTAPSFLNRSDDAALAALVATRPTSVPHLILCQPLTKAVIAGIAKAGDWITVPEPITVVTNDPIQILTVHSEYRRYKKLPDGTTTYTRIADTAEARANPETKFDRRTKQPPVLTLTYEILTIHNETRYVLNLERTSAPTGTALVAHLATYTPVAPAWALYYRLNSILNSNAKGSYYIAKIEPTNKWITESAYNATRSEIETQIKNFHEQRKIQDNDEVAAPF